MPSSVPIWASSSSQTRAAFTILDGRRVMLVAVPGDNEEEGSTNRGALSVHDAAVLERAFRSAREERVPILGLLSTSGVDVSEGVEAVVGWGRAANELVRASGIVPILLAATGPVVSGPALMLGLADFTFFTEDAYAFVSGPLMVASFTGVPISAEDLGGASAHARSSGVAAMIVADTDEAISAMSMVLSYLPDHVDQLPARIETTDPIDRRTEIAADTIPSHATGSYDVRDIVRDLADDEDFCEIRAFFAPNLVTGFATLDGYTVGIVANQSQALAGSIDIPASHKGARFVQVCDSFGIPLLTLVDTSGFLPGKDLEWRGMIRHGAQLAFAYARATVPRIALILRKSYGGAYIVMDSRYMGNDIMFAWPGAEVAVMGAKGAVEILHRNAGPDERAQLEADYEARYLTPYPTAERGSISAVIDPVETRRELAAALAMLITKREPLRARRHDNMPL